MNDSIATPVKAKKTRISAGKTQVGRPGPAANEALPIAAWVLPMTSILKKLEDLAMAAMEVVDTGDGEDIFASRIDRLASVHFERANREIEQGLRNSSLVLEFLYDAEAMIRGAQAVDVASPNREALHRLMLDAIKAVTMTESHPDFNDAELAQILAGLPNPDQVPLIMAGLSDQAPPNQPQPKQEATEQKAKPAFVNKNMPMSLDDSFGRILALDASFDIEGAALQLIRRSRELDLPPEDGAELRSIGTRIKDLNSVLMSALSGDDVLTIGDAHHALFRGAVPFPEGVAA